MLTKVMVLNLYNKMKKAEFFESLPEDLSDYEKWLPAFRLVDSSSFV